MTYSGPAGANGKLLQDIISKTSRTITYLYFDHSASVAFLIMQLVQTGGLERSFVESGQSGNLPTIAISWSCTSFTQTNY
ncbi:MAG: hypothetical protein L3K15_08860 [Thermoplasmata archaeon]|nr:hypothetical protein [Thermoplasmata archaeon]